MSWSPIAHWDSDANRYVFQRWLETPARQNDANELTLLLEKLLPYGVNSILDLGCGPGYWIHRSLLAHARQCVGVDSSLTRLRLCTQGIPVCADARFLPFRNESFDAVVVIHALEYMPAAKTVLTEVWRVLKPGGVVFVCTKNPFGIPWRMAFFLSEHLAKCAHRPSCLSPDIIVGAWPGELRVLKYLRPRIITDLRDVNDAVRLRLPTRFDTLLDRVSMRLPARLNKWLAWHFVTVLSKGTLPSSA